MSAQPDNVNARVVATVGICGVVITYAIVLWLQGIYGEDQQLEDYRKSTMMQRNAYRGLAAEQEASMADYAVIDEQAGRYALPIERAMEVVVKDVRTNPGLATPPMPSGVAPLPAGAPMAGGDAGRGSSAISGGPLTGASGGAPEVPEGIKAVGGLGTAAEAAATQRGLGTEQDPAPAPKKMRPDPKQMATEVPGAADTPPAAESIDAKKKDRPRRRKPAPEPRE